ncbi:amidohydrolase/deacetylase family metallohydrolase [Providencia rettgeri]|uniref:Amidohydrolase/deacetylase family metallohydrolase n=3 Tax=Providencia TaxID=586 RepID=A0ABT9APQ4_9GAMM|nr:MULTISPECIES: amidohydrolase/deacetylase family metallohydrolase [Providencia]MDO7830404.1 amidohydrolase/deacetylase family metallohydrolase [Providencia sp. CRE-138-0026]MDO7856574.1 amidohydrolase/deacetylase family metallohydrolase [Providencia sp. CRE-138-0111]MDR9616079.1 amidohydrolase/deacetylase family metallohydrolase [Providencia rettgeri]
MYTLIIKQAKRIDGAIIDILIKDGKIDAAGPELANNQQADKVIDLKGKCYVSAGWIDSHAHCFVESPIYFDDPDLAGAAGGVTSLVDAGSVGADDVDKFYQLTQKSKTNVFSLLNISRIGIIAQNELSDMNNINETCFQEAIERHNGFIVGMKARMSKSVVGENGITPLIKAKEMQKKHHLPLMVHIGNNPPNIDEVADLLTRGDIITHCFNGKPNKILGDDGYLKPSIARALARGVILDVGHGGESFSFKVAEQAMRIGTYPDIISSDIYHRNRVNGPVYSLAFVMTKFLCMGFSAEQVLRCVTEKAADLLSLPAKGYLKPGFDADITLFDLKEEPTELTDAEGEHRIGTHRFVPIAAIVGGKHIIHAEGESEHAINLW